MGIAFLGLLLVLAGFHRFWWSLPVGAGPAGPAVPAQPFRSAWTTRPVLLVGMGDSITAGFGASRGHSYFELLLTNAPEDPPDLRGCALSAVFPRLAATNLAMSGSTSQQHLRSQLPRLPAQPSNTLGVVVLTTGGNDLIHNYGRSAPVEGAAFGATWLQAQPWSTNFAQRLETMVSEIRARFPGGCHLFLANIYDPTDGTGDARRVGLPLWPDAMPVLAAYNKILADCAARHPWVHLVNIHDPFLGHGLCCSHFWQPHYQSHDPHYWYHDNLEDPNDRGYDALRRLFLTEIARVLGPAAP